MTVADDIKAARAEIEKGWYKGWLGDGKRVCAVGALNKICAGSITSFNQRRDIAMLQINKHLPEGFNAIASFNDDPKTKKQDILDLFDKTLADLGAI